jgi:YfiR/HmsC-like
LVARSSNWKGLTQLRGKSIRSQSPAGPTPPSLRVIFLLFVLLGTCFAQDTASTEYQVKAAYLFNFAKFVEWPTGAFRSPNSPLVICVLGLNPFGSDLEGSIAGKTVGGHRLKISNLPHGLDASSCQIVFIASSEKGQMREILQSLTGASVLTVGDTSGFTDDGGMINFVLEGERVRFEANVDAAEHAHLRLSARLLTVAKLVVGKSQVGIH